MLYTFISITLNFLDNIYIYIYVYIYLYIYTYIYIYTGCPRRNVPDFGSVFLMLKYTDITQNTYVKSWTVTEIIAREVWNFDSCYTLIDYQIHIKTGKEYVVSVMLISVLNIKLTCEWHKAIKLNYKNTRTHVILVPMVPSTIRDMNAQHWCNRLTMSSPWRKYICSLSLAWSELPSYDTTLNDVT